MDIPQENNTDVSGKEQHYEWLKEYQFKKGQSGNPAGRPKGSFTVRSYLIDFLDENPKDLADLILDLVKKYPVQVQQAIDGKPPQPVDVGNRDGEPFIIEIK